jgi:polyisoprenoid-binding protein YceI
MLFTFIKRLSIACLLIVVIASASTLASSFVLDTTKQADSVYFRSQAKLEFIEGVTSHIAGSIEFNPDSPSDSVKGMLQVDLRTLATGIKTRDEHMRDNHLHTEKFPYAYFELMAVDELPASWKADSVYALKAQGYFYIHGVKRKLTTQIQAMLTGAGDRQILSIRTSFQVNLDSYKISRPKALFMKLAETMNIEVIFKGYSGLGAPSISLPNWAELK